MSANSSPHAVAFTVARRRGLDLEPTPGQAPEAFAGQVLDSLADHLAALIEDRLQASAEDLQDGTSHQKAARALRWAVTDLDPLVADIAALCRVVENQGADW